jgi:hypothetical protein
VRIGSICGRQPPDAPSGAASAALVAAAVSSRSDAEFMQ